MFAHGFAKLIAQPFRFQGQYEDQETGLFYNRYRYYDPDSARYLTQDPIGLAGGINTFQYVPNPTGWIDPLGLAKIKNKIEGDRREDIFKKRMEAQNPNATIQCECYLRNEQKESVKDPVTGERRRVDTVVIEGGKAKTYEVTSPTADKADQLAKEVRIRAAGGTYIKDRSTGKLVPVSGISTVERIE